jgi:hypothetical protein
MISQSTAIQQIQGDCCMRPQFRQKKTSDDLTEKLAVDEYSRLQKRLKEAYFSGGCIFMLLLSPTPGGDAKRASQA